MFHPLVLESVVEVRSWQASVLACVVLAGTNEGLAGPRVLERTCSIGDLVVWSYSENPSLR